MQVNRGDEVWHCISGGQVQYPQPRHSRNANGVATKMLNVMSKILPSIAQMAIQYGLVTLRCRRVFFLPIC